MQLSNGGWFGVAAATIFVMALTAAEAILPLVIFVLSLLIAIETFGNALLMQGNDELMLVVSILGLTVSSCLLFITLIVQAVRSTVKGILIVRHVLNVAVTVFAVIYMVSVGEGREEKTWNRITDNWPSVAAEKFEDANNCVGFAECRDAIGKSFKTVFTNGRAMKPVFGLFWAVMILYGLVGMALMVLTYLFGN